MRDKLDMIELRDQMAAYQEAVHSGTVGGVARRLWRESIARRLCELEGTRARRTLERAALGGFFFVKKGKRRWAKR